jgi:hypothetical protein
MQFCSVQRWCSRYSDWLRAGRSGDRIPMGARFSAPVQTGPGAHPASCAMGTRSFPGVKSGRCVTLTPHPFPVPWSWKSRAIPLLPQWAFRLYRATMPVQGYTLQRWCFVVCLWVVAGRFVKSVRRMVSVVGDGVELELLVWTSNIVMLDITVITTCMSLCDLPMCVPSNVAVACLRVQSTTHFSLSRLVCCHLVEVSHFAHVLHTHAYWTLRHPCKYGSGLCGTHVNMGLADLICVNLFMSWPWWEKQVMTAY